MLASAICVRAATQGDAEALAHLSGELGYAVTATQVRERLAYVERKHDHATFVAVAPDKGVVGWIQLSESRPLEVEPRAEITGLVVDSGYRSAGVGRLLVERGEVWSRERGLQTIGVRSNVVRERAHSFYERLGYAVVKSQKVFRKSL
jgi:ribosomal protein S18 acetylase RimI-like enzyme